MPPRAPALALLALAAAAVGLGCGSVTGRSTDAGTGDHTGSEKGGTGGSANTGSGGSTATGAGGGVGGNAVVDSGTTTGLLGSYFATDQGGASYMTRVDSTIDFDPGPSGLEPGEVTWTGEINVNPGTSLELSANATDHVSIYVHNPYYSNGVALGTGQVTTVISMSISGWASITIDIKRTDLMSPFKAVLTGQLVTDGSVGPIEPVATDDLRPE